MNDDQLPLPFVEYQLSEEAARRDAEEASSIFEQEDIPALIPTVPWWHKLAEAAVRV